MLDKLRNKESVFIPNTGRNLPNMKVKTPMPSVKPPKSSDPEQSKKNS